MGVSAWEGEGDCVYVEERKKVSVSVWMGEDVCGSVGEGEHVCV